MRTLPVRPLGPLCAAVLGAVLLSACAAPPAPAQPAAHHHGAGASSPQARPAGGQALPWASMEQIAATAGCASPSMQVDAAELRQAACQTSRGRYTLVTFTTDGGKRVWLDNAQMYGGTYLVGDRWVVVAEPALLEGLRERLGGMIEAVHH
ncbi:hypothetical protein ACWEPC_29205 [Nonomuraea sp. NPDC004297]